MEVDLGSRTVRADRYIAVVGNQGNYPVPSPHWPQRVIEGLPQGTRAWSHTQHPDRTLNVVSNGSRV